MTITHNILAMNAERMYGAVVSKKQKSIEKLSSGYRINRAADDAAGLAISEKMRRQIRGLTQGVENTQDGVSLCQIADGALAEVCDMVNRLNELCIKAANGTMSRSDREHCQEEVDELLTEIDRVGETSKFNELYIFKGDKNLGGGGLVYIPADSEYGKGDKPGSQGTGTVTPPVTPAPSTPNINKPTGASTNAGGIINPPISTTSGNHSYGISTDEDGVHIKDDNGVKRTISWDNFAKGGEKLGDGAGKAKDSFTPGTYKATDAATGVEISIEIADAAATKSELLSSLNGGYINTTVKNEPIVNSVTINGSVNSDEKNLTYSLKADGTGISLYSKDGSSAEKLVKTKAWGDIPRTAGTHDVDFGDGLTLKLNLAKDTNPTELESILKNATLSDQGVHRKDYTFNSTGTSPNPALISKYSAVFHDDDFSGTGQLPTDGTAFTGKLSIIDVGTDKIVELEMAGGKKYRWNGLVNEKGDYAFILQEYDNGTFRNSTVNIYPPAGKRYYDFVADLGSGSITLNFQVPEDKVPTGYEHTFNNSKLTLSSAGSASNVRTTETFVSLTAPGVKPPPVPKPPGGGGGDDDDDDSTPPHKGVSGRERYGLQAATRVWIQSGADARDGMELVIDAMNTKYLHLNWLNVETASNAFDSINYIEDALVTLNESRARIGAQQNRLEHTIANENNIIENTQAAESLIRDTNMADAMVEFSKNSILQQVGESMITQSNSLPESILRLLQ